MIGGRLYVLNFHLELWNPVIKDETFLPSQENNQAKDGPLLLSQGRGTCATFLIVVALDPNSTTTHTVATSLVNNNPERTCLKNSVRTVGAPKQKYTNSHDGLNLSSPLPLLTLSLASLPFLISLLSFCYPVHSFTLKQCLDLSCLSLLLHILLSLFQTHLLHKKYFCWKPEKLSACCAGYQQF